jgi:hypothetical protein
MSSPEKMTEEKTEVYQMLRELAQKKGLVLYSKQSPALFP